MRQKLTINFLMMLLMIFSLVQLNAQTWQVYDGSKLPVDEGLQSSDVGGLPIVHTIINDADIPFNRIYEYRLLGPDSKQQWRSPYSTAFDSITIVARVRALSPDISAVQLRIRNGQYRFVIKIEGNRINPDNVVVGNNYNVDAENWHIYRVTVENYSVVKIYLDEAATPVLIDTSSTTTSDTYFRWGDGSDGDPHAGQIDWIVWDTSGAYAPGAGAALPASAADDVDQPVVYFITDDDRDDPQIDFLKLQGFDVKKFWLPAGLGAAGPDTVNMLNAADLVIIGRSGPSSSFQQPADKKAWNNLTAPVLLNCAWKSRSSRLNWFESTGAYHENTAPPLAYAKVLAPADPIFENVTLVGDSLGWNLPPHDFIRVDSVITGDILATYNNTSILIARWDAGDEFYPDGLDTAKGPRTFMPLGNDDTDRDGADYVNYWIGLTKGAKAVMLAEIYRLVGMDIMEPVYPNSDNRIVFITDDERDDIEINFLRDQGLSVDVFWPPAAISTLGEDTIDMLNSYDLVIIGRSGPSSSFQQAADKKIWNALTPPLILNCQWKARSSRLNWFESTAAYHLNTSPQLAYGKILDIYDPVFAGITLDGDSVGWSLPAHDFIRNDSLTNGDILATYDSTSVLMARWDAGEAFYPDAGDTAAGPRTYFGLGNDDAGEVNYWIGLTKAAKTVLLAEIYRLLGQELIVPAFSAADNSIIFVTDDDRDSLEIDFLKEQGFDVKAFWSANAISIVGQDTIEMLNAANLVIIGRSGPSTSFQQPADKAIWNDITAPVILNCQWKARSSRLNWFESTNAYHQNTAPLVAYGNVLVPSDPVFAGVTLVGDSLPWSLPAHDFIGNDSLTNGDILATYNSTSVLMARWDAGEAFYPDAGDTAAGPRTYFGLGNDDTGDINYWKGLTKEAKSVFLAEVYRILGQKADAPVFITSDNNIIFITDDERDSIEIEFLKLNGFNVKEFWTPGAISAVAQDTIDMLNNGADFVIIGRSGPSTSFQQPADKAIWNAITAPLMLNCQWKARSSRLNWFESTNAYHQNTEPDTAYGHVEDNDDPIWEFCTLAGDSLLWSIAPHDFIGNDSVINGDIVATYNDNAVLCARWDAGMEFYPGAADTAGGPRSYFGLGNDDTGVINYWIGLTEDAQKACLAEIQRMLGIEITDALHIEIPAEPCTDAQLATLTTSAGTLTPAFAPATTTYVVELAAGTTTVPTITATQACGDAGSVTITAATDLSGTTTVVSTPEEGDPMTYTITFHVAPDAINEINTISVNVYPNPAEGTLFVSASASNCNVELYNILGEKVLTQLMTSNITQIDVSNLDAGVYIIKITSGEYKVNERVIIK